MLKITHNYSLSRKISNVISDTSSFQTAVGSLLRVHALTVQASNWSDTMKFHGLPVMGGKGWGRGGSIYQCASKKIQK